MSDLVTVDGQVLDVGEDLNDVTWLFQAIRAPRLKRLAWWVWSRIPGEDQRRIRELPTLVVQADGRLEIVDLTGVSRNGHLGDFGVVATDGSRRVGRIRLRWPLGFLSDRAIMWLIVHEFQHAYEQQDLEEVALAAGARLGGMRPEVDLELAAAVMAMLETDADRRAAFGWNFWRECVAYYREAGVKLPGWFLSEFDFVD